MGGKSGAIDRTVKLLLVTCTAAAFISITSVGFPEPQHLGLPNPPILF